MSVNKRGNRGREDALRYGSVAFQILPLNCMRRMFYPALTVCAVRLSPHPNVSLNVFLYVSIGLWPRPTRTKKNYISECAVCWMCFTIVPDSLCIHTHLNVAVVRSCFFWYSLILSSNVHSCVLDVRPVRFLFFLFFLTSCSIQQSFKCYRQSWEQTVTGLTRFQLTRRRFYDHNLSPPQHAPTQTASVCF